MKKRKLEPSRLNNLKWTKKYLSFLLLGALAMAFTESYGQSYTNRIPTVAGMYEQVNNAETVIIPYDYNSPAAHASGYTVVIRSIDDYTSSPGGTPALQVALLDRDGLPLVSTYQDLAYDFSGFATGSYPIPVSAARNSNTGEYAITGYIETNSGGLDTWVMILDRDLTLVTLQTINDPTGQYLFVTDICASPNSPTADFAITGRTTPPGSDFIGSIGAAGSNIFLMTIQTTGSFSIAAAGTPDFAFPSDERSSVPTDIKEVPNEGFFVTGRVAGSYSGNIERGFYLMADDNLTAYSGYTVTGNNFETINPMQVMINGTSAYISGSLDGGGVSSSFFFDRVDNLSATTPTTVNFFNQTTPLSNVASRLFNGAIDELPYLQLPFGAPLYSNGFTFVESIRTNSVTNLPQIGARMMECNIDNQLNGAYSNDVPGLFEMDFASAVDDIAAWTATYPTTVNISTYPRFNGNGVPTHSNDERAYYSQLLPAQQSIKPIGSGGGTDFLVQSSIGVQSPGTTENTLILRSANGDNQCVKLDIPLTPSTLFITTAALGAVTTINAISLTPNINTPQTTPTYNHNLNMEQCANIAIRPAGEEDAIIENFKIWYASGNLLWNGDTESVTSIQIYSSTGQLLQTITALEDYCYAMHSLAEGIYVVAVQRSNAKAQIVKIAH